MSEVWRRKLDAGEIVIVDGGVGSELGRRGMPLDPDAWGALAPLTHFELLHAVHADYIAAGADVIVTNTFATARFVLEPAGAGAELARINQLAVEAARSARSASARGRDVAIAGSMSCLPPRFDVRSYPNAAREEADYRELAECLAEAGVDLLVLEMLQDTEHALRLVRAARSVGLPLWMGVSCRLVAGELVAYDFPDRKLMDFLPSLLDQAPAVLNVMHSPIPVITDALLAIGAAWQGALGAYPEKPGPERLDAPIAEWMAAGARVLGGCCGTTPEDIRELSAEVRTRARA